MNVRNRQSRCSRALVLVALLLVGAWQVQEAGHHHAPDETVAECLLCKSTQDTAVPLPTAAPPPPLVTRFMLPQGNALRSRLAHTLFDVRAPPFHS